VTETESNVGIATVGCRTGIQMTNRGLNMPSGFLRKYRFMLCKVLSCLPW